MNAHPHSTITKKVHPKFEYKYRKFDFSNIFLFGKKKHIRPTLPPPIYPILFCKQYNTNTIQDHWHCKTIPMPEILK